MGNIQIDSNIYYFAIGLIIILLLVIVIMSFVISYFKGQLKESVDDNKRLETGLTFRIKENELTMSQIKGFQDAFVKKNTKIVELEKLTDDLNVQISSLRQQQIAYQQKPKMTSSENPVQHKPQAHRPVKRKDKGSESR